MDTKDIINLQYTTIKSPLPDFIYDGLKAFSAKANNYKPQPSELIEKLAKKHNLPTEMIYLTAGIDEAIQIFAKSYGQNAFVFTPAYVVYSDVEEFGGKLTRLYSIEGEKFNVKTDKLEGATLIYLANPNNPSGFTSKEKVLELIENNKDTVVCIDEAYGEFAPELSVIDQVQKYPKLAVFRSFSKDYGMAGNRIGYFMAHPDIIKTVSAKTQWASVSYLSIGAAITALDHEDYFIKMRRDINERRDAFMKFLETTNLKFFPSRINAILFKFDSIELGKKFAEYLKNNNFVVSPGNGHSNIGLDESFVRISVGTEEQMNALKDVLVKYA